MTHPTQRGHILHCPREVKWLPLLIGMFPCTKNNAELLLTTISFSSNPLVTLRQSENIGIDSGLIGDGMGWEHYDHTATQSLEDTEDSMHIEMLQVFTLKKL